MFESAVVRQAWRLRDITEPDVDQLRDLTPDDLEALPPIEPPENAAPVSIAQVDPPPEAPPDAEPPRRSR